MNYKVILQTTLLILSAAVCCVHCLIAELVKEVKMGKTLNTFN
jgi:hypothetical protein